jgi:hypothetical protein
MNAAEALKTARVGGVPLRRRQCDARRIAAHNAAMECCSRAMIGEQTLEGWRENPAQANELSRTYATLLEALNRHRGNPLKLCVGTAADGEDANLPSQAGRVSLADVNATA